MKKAILLLAIALCNTLCFAQESCGFDHFINQMKRDSISGSDFDSVRFYIQKQIVKNKNKITTFSVTQTNNYVIPVVFHLVGANASALTDAQVQAQLTLLNQGFANLLGSTYGVADDAQIRFCLAQTLPNGQPWANITTYNPNLFYNATAGITRCTTSVANTVSANHNMNPTGTNSQQALVNVAYNGFSFTNYMNVWVVDQISQVPSPYVNSVVGYAPFPIMGPAAFLDGVVMRLDGFGIGSTGLHYNQGRILIHETGHYLGLFHTFQFGCTEVINGTPCSTSGDECCDTPPVAVPNQTSCASLSASPPNSCNESPDLPDMYENHMDYAYDQPGSCRNTFTDDQANRMHATIQVYRSNLVSFSNLIATGLTSVTGCMANAIDPTFISNLPGGSLQVCTGQGIGFMAGSGAATYNWSFPGGLPASAVGTYSPTGITYAAPGTYSVSLNITDALGNTYFSSLQVFVSACTSYTGNKANWYFGTNSSVSFSTGIAVAQNPSSINTDEMSAAVSDNTGSLLFYTNGKSVWNNTHAPMTNGNNTLNGSPNGGTSTSQGVLIVPRPGTANHYYIYTHSDVNTPMNILGLSQYEVDMGTPAGIVTSTVPVNPAQNYANEEPVIAVPHCNGTDYWVIVKPKNNTQPGLISPGPLATINQYLASYLVTNSGINNTPVLSVSAPFTPSVGYIPSSNDGIAQMAISPDKKIFCIADMTAASGYLYYFDCATGLFNYLATLPGIDGYGVAFSANSRVLYAKSNFKIRQYDLSNISQCQSNPPFVAIPMIPPGYTTPMFTYGSLQLGPDGRVYVGRPGFFASPQKFLGVINFPNMINTSATSNECGYNFSGVPLLSSQSCRLDLPNDIVGQSGAVPDEFSFCIKNCGQACFTSLGCGTNFSWDFGDGYTASGTNTVIPAGTNAGTTSGNFEYPCHTYATPGTYTVSLSVDGHTAVTHTLNISLPAAPLITGPLCPVTGVQESYYGPAGFTYSWTATNASPTTGNAQTFNTTWITLPASLTLTVTDPNNGCSATSTVAIAPSSSGTITISPSTSTICAGSTQTLCASGTSTYTWSTGSNSTCITVTPTTTTVYTVTGGSGTCGTATATATVSVVPKPNICLTPTLSMCSNTCNVLNGICDGDDPTALSYTWSPPGGIASVHSGSTVACPKVTTTYTLTAQNAFGCITSSATTIYVLPTPTVVISPATSTICAGATQTLCASGAATYTWSTGSNSVCISVTPTTTTVYTVIATGDNFCTGGRTATVYVNPKPSLCISSPTTICSGTCTVLNAACGGTASVSYTWSPTAGLGSPFTGSTTACPTVTTVYTVTAVTAVGCTNTGTTSITVVATPTISALPATSTVCAGTSQLLCASAGPTTYTWSTGANSACITVTPAVTTVYTVTASKNGCTSAPATNTVTVKPAPVICVSPTVTICSGSCTIINAACQGSSHISYTWSPTTGLASPFTPSTTACPTVTTVYTVTATNSAGCTTIGATTVYVTPTPTVNITPLTSTICAGSSQTLCASGATSYTWSTGSNSTCIVVTPTATVVYTVTGSSGGCKSAIKTATVVVVAKPTVTITPATPTVCAGSGISICASGAVTYTWSTGTISSCITVTPSATSVYTVTGSNGGCLANPVTTTVTVIAKPVICMSPSYTICPGICKVLSGKCSGLAAFTSYQWQPSAGLTTPTSLTTTACPTVTTIYTLTATNFITGCSTTGTTAITVAPATLAVSGPTSVVCGTNHLYSVSPVVFTLPVNYSWSATNATPASGFGTSANISFIYPGGVITWGATTYIDSVTTCKVKVSYTVTCQPGTGDPIGRGVNGKDDGYASIYPNPNNGAMVLDYVIDADGTLDILDANNKLVARYKVNAKEQKMEINNEQLVNGVYVYRLMVKNEIIKTDKIVIIK